MPCCFKLLPQLYIIWTLKKKKPTAYIIEPSFCHFHNNLFCFVCIEIKTLSFFSRFFFHFFFSHIFHFLVQTPAYVYLSFFFSVIHVSAFYWEMLTCFTLADLYLHPALYLLMSYWWCFCTCCNLNGFTFVPFTPFAQFFYYTIYFLFCHHLWSRHPASLHMLSSLAQQQKIKSQASLQPSKQNELIGVCSYTNASLQCLM